MLVIKNGRLSSMFVPCEAQATDQLVQLVWNVNTWPLWQKSVGPPAALQTQKKAILRLGHEQ